MRLRALLLALAVAASFLISVLAGGQPVAVAAGVVSRADRWSPPGAATCSGRNRWREGQLRHAGSRRAGGHIPAVNGGTTLDVDRLVHAGPTRRVPGSSDLVIDPASNDDQRQAAHRARAAALSAAGQLHLAQAVRGAAEAVCCRSQRRSPAAGA